MSSYKAWASLAEEPIPVTESKVCRFMYYRMTRPAQKDLAKLRDFNKTASDEEKMREAGIVLKETDLIPDDLVSRTATFCRLKRLSMQFLTTRNQMSHEATLSWAHCKAGDQGKEGGRGGGNGAVQERQ